jgi:hypothetical protein
MVSLGEHVAAKQKSPSAASGGLALAAVACASRSETRSSSYLSISFSSQAFVAAPSFTAGEQAALGQAVDVLRAVLDLAVP